jgi:signal peptidase
MTDKKPNKLFSLVTSLVQTFLIIALLVVSFTSFASRVPFLASSGFTFYNIVSGSMEPMIPTGSLIYAGHYKVEDLKKGDVITFQIKPSDQSKPVVVTHRIAEVIKTEKMNKLPDGKEKKIVEYQFKTKGDANNKVDETILTTGNILGKYAWHIPKLGYVSSFAQQPTGFALLVLFPAAILIIWEIVSLVMYFKNHYENKSKQELEKMRKELEAKHKSESADA